MKTKLIIILFFLQNIFCNTFGQNSALQIIKDNVAEKFNIWLTKGEFEKTSDYEIRLKSANEKLQEIIQVIITEQRDEYLKGIFIVSKDKYNADNETYLMKVEKDYYKTFYITLKVSPNVAKNYLNKDDGYIQLIPNNVQIVNDEWIVTAGVIFLSINTDSRESKISKIENEYFVNNVNNSKAYDLKKLDGSHEYFEAKDQSFQYGWFGYYEWKIIEEPTFDSATINPLTFSLKDLHIKLPNSNSETEIQTSKVTCSVIKKKNQNAADPIIVKTCLFGSYKSISTGMPDYKGRYSYSYKLFKLTNNKYIPIRNSELFNVNKNKLLAIIKQRIQKDYNESSKDPNNEGCFDGKSAPTVTFENLKISFNDSGIEFSISYGLCGACMAVDGTNISFKIDEIKPYLNY